MITPAQYQVDAAVKEARAQLTAISSWINYNDQISDEQMQVCIRAVLTAGLYAQPPKGKSHA